MPKTPHMATSAAATRPAMPTLKAIYLTVLGKVRVADSSTTPSERSHVTICSFFTHTAAQILVNSKASRKASQLAHPGLLMYSVMSAAMFQSTRSAES